MKQIGDSLKQNALTGQQPNTSEKPRSATDKRSRRLQLAALIRQSFDIFNIYGKQAESIENVIAAFELVMEPFDESHIRAAFREWMASSANMPTPSDIGKIAERIQTEEKERRAYAEKPPVIAKANERANNYRTVPWAGKDYQTCKKENLIHLIIDHIMTFSPVPTGQRAEFMSKRDSYIHYLHHHFGFPKMVEDWR